MKPFRGLRKLYSRLKAVVIHAYYENRDTWGHLRLELLIEIAVGDAYNAISYMTMSSLNPPSCVKALLSVT